MSSRGINIHKLQSVLEFALLDFIFDRDSFFPEFSSS